MKHATKLKLRLILAYTAIMYAIPVVLSTVIDGSPDHAKFMISAITYGFGLTIGAFLISPGCDQVGKE